MVHTVKKKGPLNLQENFWGYQHGLTGHIRQWLFLWHEKEPEEIKTATKSESDKALIIQNGISNEYGIEANECAFYSNIGGSECHRA
uniref:Uncharacterized protein n=1 Tax=Anguilla anguilla TaxID=7936 RepID=A0A0E9X5C1_ANGAN